VCADCFVYDLNFSARPVRKFFINEKKKTKFLDFKHFMDNFAERIRKINNDAISVLDTTST